MPAWPGGPCPTCGEDMPENLIHCFTCRTLLNNDLESDSVEIPKFMPLQEISVMVDVPPRGYFVGCPDCGKELRINRKYIGQNVMCKHCDASFDFEVASGRLHVVAFFAACPACEEELRASPKYLGKKVMCKHCNGHLKFVDE